MSSFESFDWCGIEKRYVPRDTTAETSFGDLDTTARRHVEGFFATLTDAQRRAALAYRGPDTVAANDNHPTLDDLHGLPGFAYLGSPYSKYDLGHDAAAYVVGLAAGWLMARGFRIYSPIVHGHYIAKTHKLPMDWAYWKQQCQPMIDAAAALIVLQMDGWEESVGLTYEIEEFKRAGKPIVYATSGQVALWDRRAA